MPKKIVKEKKVSKTKKLATAKSKKVKPARKIAAAKSTRAKAAKPPLKKRAKVAAIPKGYHAVIPYLIVTDANKAIDFYKKVFAAKQTFRSDKPNGKIGHAELKIGNARIMLADEAPEMGARGPQSIGGSPVFIHLYTKNVDTTVKLAKDAGAKIQKEAEDMFYGDRAAMILDPFGHVWHIATHIENVSPATLKKRVAEMYGKKS